MQEPDSTAGTTQPDALELPPPSTSVDELRARLAGPRRPRRRQLGQLLVESGALHDTGVRRALASQSAQPDMRFGTSLLLSKAVDEDQLYRALSEQIGVPYVRLAEFALDPTAQSLLPTSTVREHRVLPLFIHGDRLDGVVQIQVNTAIELDFASVLRNILRHDPDIILVGEIRDAETAKIAIESALTGHLVLSTLHTNSAAQTVTRLVEIGIPPYLVNATLAGVLAQRLVRRNCPHCRIEEDADPEVRATLGVDKDERFWRGKGCGECAGTGTRGRVAVYELLEMNTELRHLVIAGASFLEIEAAAVAGGMVRLTEQALGLARAGDISLREVFHARLD